MKVFSKTVLVLGLSVLTLVATSCGLRDPGEPGFEVKWLWTDMMYPVPYESYSENPVFKNRVTMQTPVPGTVHREAWVVEDESKNPLPVSSSVVNQGGHLYGNFCMHCHGVTGKGEGPVSAKFLKPPTYQEERVMALSSKDIFDVITNGKGAMPSHGKQIDPMDRWRIVRYVEKELQGK